MDLTFWRLTASLTTKVPRKPYKHLKLLYSVCKLKIFNLAGLLLKNMIVRNEMK